MVLSRAGTREDNLSGYPYHFIFNPHLHSTQAIFSAGLILNHDTH